MMVNKVMWMMGVASLVLMALMASGCLHADIGNMR